MEVLYALRLLWDVPCDTLLVANILTLEISLDLEKVKYKCCDEFLTAVL